MKSPLVFLASVCLCVLAGRAAPPFAGASGNYNGLATPGAGVDVFFSGIVNLDVLPTGAFSGKLDLTGLPAKVTGKFAADTGEVDRWIPRGTIQDFDGTVEPLFLRLKATLDPAARTIEGLFEFRTQDEVFDHGTFSLSGAPPDPLVDEALASQRQNSLISPPAGGVDIPGDGFALVQVSKTRQRSARTVGRLPDGSPYSSGQRIHGTVFPVHCPLIYVISRDRNPGGGFSIFRKLLGATFGYADIGSGTRGLSANITAPLRWHKAPDPAVSYYGSGFDEQILIEARDYPRLRTGLLVPIGLVPGQRENATLTLARGNLDEPLQVTLTMKASGNRVERTISPVPAGADPNPHGVKLRVNPLLGTFSGTFIHPGSGRKTRFAGAFRLKDGSTPGEGRGAFVGSLAEGVHPGSDGIDGGSVRITVNPPVTSLPGRPPAASRLPGHGSEVWLDGWRFTDLCSQSESLPFVSPPPSCEP